MLPRQGTSVIGINLMRRSINTSEDRSRRIALAAAYLGLPSSEAFIQLAVDHELSALASRSPLLRRELDLR